MLGEEKHDLLSDTVAAASDDGDFFTRVIGGGVTPVVDVGGPVVGGFLRQPGTGPAEGTEVEGVAEAAHEGLVQGGEGGTSGGVPEEEEQGEGQGGVEEGGADETADWVGGEAWIIMLVRVWG